jgi:hypothetical protein
MSGSMLHTVNTHYVPKNYLKFSFMSDKVEILIHKQTKKLASISYKLMLILLSWNWILRVESSTFKIVKESLFFSCSYQLFHVHLGTK